MLHWAQCQTEPVTQLIRTWHYLTKPNLTCQRTYNLLCDNFNNFLRGVRTSRKCSVCRLTNCSVVQHFPVPLWVSEQFLLSFAINPLNAELNIICYLLALLGAHHFLHVSRIRVKSLTLRLLMSYIYGVHILDVSRWHTTTHHSR